MAKTLFYPVLTMLLLAACSYTDVALKTTPSLETSQMPGVDTTRTTTKSALPTLPAIIPSFTDTPTARSHPTSTPTATPTYTISPVILERAGELYETVFSIPVGERKIIHYNIPSCCANIEGPNAIAVLPDYTFLISDPIGRQLLYYDQEGRLLQMIQLDELGIGYVRDLRVKENDVFLLETGYQKFRVHRLTLAGELIASKEIPNQYPIDKNNPQNTLESSLTGIAIDCEERIILEVAGGSWLFPLLEVQKQPDPGLITQGLLCNGKRFYVSTPGLWKDPQVTAGEVIYRTQLSQGLGGLAFLDVFRDGSFYLVRDDVMPTTAIKVDQTIFYIDGNGLVQGITRVPLSEFYYPITRNAAVSPNGEVFALLPRPNSVDIVRLNFYKQLGPLMPSATIPQFRVSP